MATREYFTNVSAPPVTTEWNYSTDTNWTDITDGAIASGNFTVGEKYLILVAAMACGASSSYQYGIRILHGSTVFDDGQHVEEAVGNDFQQFFWFDVWTAVSGEGIKLQGWTEDTSAQVRVDDYIVIAINIDDLTEDTHYWLTINNTQTNNTASGGWATEGTDDVATEVLASSAASADDLLWILACTRYSYSNTNTNYFNAIKHGTSDYSSFLHGTDGITGGSGKPHSLEGENTADTRIACDMGLYTWTSGDDSTGHRFSHGWGSDSGGTYTKLQSKILIFHMPSVSYSYSTAIDESEDNSITQGSDPGDDVDECSLTMDATTASEPFIYLTQFTSNADNTNARSSVLYTKLDAASYTRQPLAANVSDQNPNYDPDDRNAHWHLRRLLNIPNGSTYYFKTTAFSNDTSETPVWDRSRAIIWSLVIPSAAQTVEKDLQDTFTFTDSQRRDAWNTRLWNDVATFTDDIWRSRWRLQDISDSFTFSDAIAFIRELQRQLQDTQTFTDAINRIFYGDRTLADTAALSDQISRVLVVDRLLADGFSFADQIVTHFSFVKQLADAFTFADQILRDSVNVRDVQDSASFADQVERVSVVVRDLADTFTFLDQIATNLIYERTLSDSSTLADQITFRRLLERQIADSLVFADQLLRDFWGDRFQADLAGIVDNLDRTVTQSTPTGQLVSRDVSDSIVLAEQVARDFWGDRSVKI